MATGSFEIITQHQYKHEARAWENLELGWIHHGLGSGVIGVSGDGKRLFV